jgi:hypothetical protein
LISGRPEGRILNRGPPDQKNKLKSFEMNEAYDKFNLEIFRIRNPSTKTGN